MSKLSDQLRTLIKEEVPGYPGQATGLLATFAERVGITPESLGRFIKEERGLSMESLDTLWDYFGLELET